MFSITSHFKKRQCMHQYDLRKKKKINYELKAQCKNQIAGDLYLQITLLPAINLKKIKIQKLP